jgi:AcrR family transcriptional regulator
MASSSVESAVPVSGRQAGRELRRRRILDAAVALFETKGFEGATTDEIAAAAEVTKRTLYRYVGSKEELLYEIHEDFMTGLLEEAKDFDGSPEQRFRSMVAAHIADLATYLPYIKVFFEEIKHLTPTKRGELVARRQSYEKLVNHILEDGLESGDFRDLDVRSTTRAILGAMNEGYRWYRQTGRYSASKIADQTSHTFLQGLASPRVRRTVAAAVEDAVRRRFKPAEVSSSDPMDRIVEAATSLFSAQGYHRTSTQEIADRAGLTKGALFYHVRYKEEALLQIHQRFFERTLSALSELEDNRRPALEVIANLVLTYVQVVALNREAMAVVSEERKYLPPEAAEQVTQSEAACYDILERTIRRGMLAGEVATEDAHISTMLIVGMMNSIYRWYRHGAARKPAELGREMADLVLRGITAETP